MSKGFSLIELLVAVSVIGVLATIGISSYKGIQAKARDSARKSDLTHLALALEAYKLAHNNKYIDGTSGSEGNCSSNDTARFYTDIVSYMSNNKVAKDPKTGANYCYLSVGDGQSFRICANLENTNDLEINTVCQAYNYNYGIVPR